jgi:UDP-N-acetylmuramate--alanine ligase
MRDVKKTFIEFMDRVPFYGIIVACNDDPLLRRLLPEVQRRTVTYGTKRGSDFQIKVPTLAADHAARMGQPLNRFRVSYRSQDLGEFTLHVPGVHNVLNATAAIAVGIGLDIGVDAIRSALDQFRGVDRRFQLRGVVAGVSVIDDYGHHPTEIKATLAAAKQCGFRKIHVIFQPHRYTRTRDLADEFATAFRDTDTLQILDIYAASEDPIPGITAESLVQRIRSAGTDVDYAPSFQHAVNSAARWAQSGDIVLTLGAGSVYQIGPMLLDKLANRSAISESVALNTSS